MKRNTIKPLGIVAVSSLLLLTAFACSVPSQFVCIAQGSVRLVGEENEEGAGVRHGEDWHANKDTADADCMANNVKPADPGQYGWTTPQEDLAQYCEAAASRTTYMIGSEGQLLVNVDPGASTVDGTCDGWKVVSDEDCSVNYPGS